MTRQQHAALLWAKDNLSGKERSDFVAAVLDLAETEKRNDKRLLDKYPMFNN